MYNETDTVTAASQPQYNDNKYSCIRTYKRLFLYIKMMTITINNSFVHHYFAKNSTEQFTPSVGHTPNFDVYITPR